MRQAWHSWGDWWFDRPWMYALVFGVGLLVWLYFKAVDIFRES